MDSSKIREKYKIMKIFVYFMKLRQYESDTSFFDFKKEIKKLNWKKFLDNDKILIDIINFKKWDKNDYNFKEKK